jgi:transposase
MEVQIQTARGIPLSAIARNLGIDRKTARKLRDMAGEPTVTVRRRQSRLSVHREYVAEQLRKGIPAAQICRDLARAGTPIPYPTVRDFARKLRPAKTPAEYERRFETPPAKQAQCDWSEIGRVAMNGSTLPLYVFVMILGYSRRLFAQLTTSMDELVLQRAHVSAFASFGGVPHEVLYDNMRTVTIGRDEHNQPVLQREFRDFAGLYGFNVRCAQPYRAKTKGKVERAIGFIQTSFLPGRRFVDIADGQRQLEAWVADVNTRVHRTHKERIDERFAREAPLLLPLRSDLRIVEHTEKRVVGAEGSIAYRANRYAVPAGHRGRTVLIRDDGEHVRIYLGKQMLIEHTAAQGKGQIVDGSLSVGVPLTALVSAMIDQTFVDSRPLSAYEDLIG